MRSIKDKELRITKREIKRIFKCKLELSDVCLNQLNKSISSKIKNSTPEYIKNYILKGDKINLLVTWNGHSDKNIQERLEIRDFQM